MKKTTRLTALLVSLVLLLGTLSASATGFAEGIPFGEFDLSSYETMLTDAEAVGLSASQPCGKSNPYCASVSKIAGLANAKARYDYLASMSSLDAIGVLMHYHDYHEADNTVCLCTYPNFDAAYVPGGLNHDAACPWHFANLTVDEQFDILVHMSETERAPYLEKIQDIDKLALLNAYLEYAGATYVEPCNPDTCPYNAKYTDIDFFTANTFTIYEYLFEMNEYANSLGDTDEGWDAQTAYLGLVSHLRDAHIAEGIYCQCWSFDMSNPEHAFGTLNHSDSEFCGATIECPWRFDRLKTAEQAQIYNGLSANDKSKYYAELNDKQKAELDAFLAGIGKAEATIPSEDNAVTVDISVPADVFGTGVNYVMEAGEAQMTTEKVGALNEVFVGHTLAAFDITFYNLDRPGEKLQPVNGTVPLTFTVDVSEADGDTMQVYHLYELNGQYIAEPVGESIAIDKTIGTQTITIEAKSFSTYTIGELCNGSGDCGYYDFIKLSGAERAELLASWVGVSVGKTDSVLDKYNDFISHVLVYHGKGEGVCLCISYDPATHGYGTIAHTDACDSYGVEFDCWWAFKSLTVEEQYEIYQTLSDDVDEETGLTEKETYLATITDEAKKEALNAYIAEQEAICVVEGNKLMCGGEQLATITENGYIIDIATGIAVGRYDRETGEFTMGTGSN